MLFRSNSRDLHNLSNCFKSITKEHGNNDPRGNKLPTAFPTVLGENRVMYFPGNIAPINGAGMRLENNESLYIHQSGIYQGFHNVPMNPDIRHQIQAQIEFQVCD